MKKILIASLATATILSQAIALANVTGTVFDVGQGDSILFNKDGKNVLIDCGPKDADNKLTSNYLSKVSSIDYLIITHPHDDHTGELKEVIETGKVKSLYMSNWKSYCTKDYTTLYNLCKSYKVPVHIITKNTTLFKGVTLNPPNCVPEKDINGYSIITKVDDGNVHLLFTGDATKEREKEFMTFSKGKVDLLKVGHHGSTTASLTAFIKSIQPKYSVISVGANNRYKLPNNSTIQKLLKVGSKVYRTDINGCITFSSNTRTLKVSTEK